MINSKKNNPHHNRTRRKAMERFCRRHGYTVPIDFGKWYNGHTPKGVWQYYFKKFNKLEFSSDDGAENFIRNHPWSSWHKDGCLVWPKGPYQIHEHNAHEFTVSATEVARLKSGGDKFNEVVAMITWDGKRREIPPYTPTPSGRVRKNPADSSKEFEEFEEVFEN